MDIIAEIGSNHEGSLSTAVDSIWEAANAGATHVKFQLFAPAEMYMRGTHLYWRSRLQRLPTEWLETLQRAAHLQRLSFGCSVFSESDLKVVGGRVDFLKLASSTVQSEELHKAVEEYCLMEGVPLYISIPGNFPEDELLNWHEGTMETRLLTILVCGTQYPLPTWDAGIQRVLSLKEQYFKIGYSDHTRSLLTGVVLAAMGGVAIEKHFRLPYVYKTPDVPVSLTPKEFRAFAWNIREAKDMLSLPAPPEGELQTLLARAKHVDRS